MPQTAEDRSAAGRIGAAVLHSRYYSREVTQAARAASPSNPSYFEREVDPEGVLEPAERARRAEHAKRAYFLRLALKSAKARAARKGAAG